MRLRVTFDRIVVCDVTLFEPESEDGEPPPTVVDASTGHDIGFSAPAGWHEPKEPGE